MTRNIKSYKQHANNPDIKIEYTLPMRYHFKKGVTEEGKSFYCPECNFHWVDNRDDRRSLTAICECGAFLVIRFNEDNLSVEKEKPMTSIFKNYIFHAEK